MNMKAKNKQSVKFSWPYKRKNYLLFGVGATRVIIRLE